MTPSKRLSPLPELPIQYGDFAGGNDWLAEGFGEQLD
jgi:hypothetical protein